MSLPRVYLETTIPSYLNAWPSRDLIIAARQQITRDWWATERGRFELYLSRFVLDEAAVGDPEAARARLESLNGIPELTATHHALQLAGSLVTEGAIPEVASTDAAHIAVAAVHRMDFILTWNFRHIANAQMDPQIRAVCARHGWACPVICSPEQLVLNDLL